VGMVDNEIYFDILTAEGESVKHNYDVTVHTGTLRVIMLEVTFRSGSAEKIYDGTPLTCGDWELIYPASLPVGHTAVVSVSGERTLVGESENTFTVNDIVNANGKSVINNFDCKYEYGALVVKPTSGENPGDEGGDGGDGGDLDSSGNIGGGGGQPQNPVPIMDVKSTVTGPLYMRLESFGDYTGRGWEKATEYSGTMYDS